MSVEHGLESSDVNLRSASYRKASYGKLKNAEDFQYRQ